MKKISLAVTLVVLLLFSNLEVQAATVSGGMSFSGGEIVEESAVSSAVALAEDVVEEKTSSDIGTNTGFSGGMSFVGGSITETTIVIPSSNEKPEEEEKQPEEPKEETPSVDKVEPPVVVPPSNKVETPVVVPPSNKVETPVVVTPSDKVETPVVVTPSDKVEDTNGKLSEEEVIKNEVIITPEDSNDEAEVSAEIEVPVVPSSNEGVEIASVEAASIPVVSMSATDSEDKESGSDLIRVLPSKEESNPLPDTDVEGRARVSAVLIGLLFLFLLLLIILLSIRYKIVDHDGNTINYASLKTACLDAKVIPEGCEIQDRFKKPSEKKICDIKVSQVVYPEYVGEKLRSRISGYVMNQ